MQQLYNEVFGEHPTTRKLEEVMEKYPYFSLVHLCLLQKTGQGNPVYASRVAKTALHFPSPYLLNYRLKYYEHKILPGEDNTFTDEPSFEEQSRGETEQEILELNAPVFEKQPVDNPVMNRDVDPDISPSTHSFGEKTDEEEMIAEENISITLDQAAVQHQTSPSTEPGVEHKEKMPAEVVSESAENNEPVQETDHRQEGATNVAVTETEIAASSPTEKTDNLLFEPLYVTDYFASQGIKVPEVKEDDKLGKQLRSFTEWLKTMKSVHGSKQEKSIPIDAAVEKMAENSNREEEVLTESMAEVFETQGKYDKAREVYEKLSLLYPAKNAYFAAKSEQLKGK